MLLRALPLAAVILSDMLITDPDDSAMRSVQDFCRDTALRGSKSHLRLSDDFFSGKFQWWWSWRPTMPSQNHLGWPLSFFPHHMKATYFWTCFFLMVGYEWRESQGADDFSFLCTWFLFYFYPFSATPQSPAHTSETSAERFALACERVHADNAMHYVFTAFVWNAAAVIPASL